LSSRGPSINQWIMMSLDYALPTCHHRIRIVPWLLHKTANQDCSRKSPCCDRRFVQPYGQSPDSPFLKAARLIQILHELGAEYGFDSVGLYLTPVLRLHASTPPLHAWRGQSRV
jgi:hypothetical protein